jgi:protoporphyrinogen oxidase
MKNMKERVAVIGAGPMGLAVAYQLARDGHCPILFEADDRIGGMSASFDFDGMEIERYYHCHCTPDLDFLQILDELGIADKLRWRETRMGYWYQGREQPWGDPVALLKFQGVGWMAKFRYGLHAFLCTRRDNWKPLDKLEATAWIRRWVGEEAWEVLWRRLFELKFHEYAYTLSAAWIWGRMRWSGRSRYDLFREKRGVLEGGTNTLLNAMKADIEAQGGEIRLNAPVSRIVLADGKAKGVEVNGVEERFDKVVSTVPLPYVPGLLPDLPKVLLDRFRAVKNIAVVCVIVKLRRSVTENFWLNINDPEMDIPGLIEHTNLQPLNEHVVYAPYYMPGEHPLLAEPDENFVKKVKRYLKTINPALADDDFLNTCVNRYRYAQPIYNPGHLDKLPPVALLGREGGLWVADTSYYLPKERLLSESIGFGRKLASSIKSA